jgi:phosphatidylethanolamine-binding protein (PEBP) family uncharacterized protein
MSEINAIRNCDDLTIDYRSKQAYRVSKTHLRARLGLYALVLGIFGAANALGDDHFDDHFRVSSTTFSNNGVLPISMIDNIPSNGTNACSVNGSPGGNQSPEVSWTHAPWGTRSFAVALFDVTASFTHWGMYRISAGTDSLPAGAGAAGSPYGAQVFNDFYNLGYDGPCPPVGVEPYSHEYATSTCLRYMRSTRN